MKTEYIDATEIASKGSGSYISRIASASNPVLVFMPNLDYTGMCDAEELASRLNIGFIAIPITLPMLDITRQMEFAGVRLTRRLVSGLEESFRSSVICQMNAEGVELHERERDHSG